MEGAFGVHVKTREAQIKENVAPIAPIIFIINI